MKVFSFFTEPASYTLDLIDNVYDTISIDYCFLNSHSNAYTSFKGKKYVFLDKIRILDRIRHLLYVRRKYDIIIFNSYDTISFFLILLINIFSITKKYIAIESDTQLLMSKNYLKRSLKHLYLSFVFHDIYFINKTNLRILLLIRKLRVFVVDKVLFLP